MPNPTYSQTPVTLAMLIGLEDKFVLIHTQGAEAGLLRQIVNIKGSFKIQNKFKDDNGEHVWNQSLAEFGREPKISGPFDTPREASSYRTELRRKAS